MVPEGPGRDLGSAAVAWAEVGAARVREEGGVSARVAGPARVPGGPVAEARAEAEACGSLAVGAMGLVLAAVLAQGRAQAGQEVVDRVALADPARVQAEGPGQVQALRASG